MAIVSDEVDLAFIGPSFGVPVIQRSEWPDAFSEAFPRGSANAYSVALGHCRLVLSWGGGKTPHSPRREDQNILRYSATEGSGVNGQKVSLETTPKN